MKREIFTRHFLPRCRRRLWWYFPLHKLLLCHRKTIGEDRNAHCRLHKNIKCFPTHSSFQNRAAQDWRNAIWGKIGFRNHQNKKQKIKKVRKQSYFFFSCATVCHERLACTGFGEERGRRRRRKTTRIASSFSLFETGLSTPGGTVRLFCAR